MSIDICVPPLGESVLEATVGKWFVEPGTYVTRDAIIVELETDKVTLEINAMMDGWLTEALVATGSTVQPGQVLGKLSAEQPEGSHQPAALDAPQTVVEVKLEAKTPEPVVVLVEKIVVEALQPSVIIPHDGVAREPMSRIRKRIAERLKDAQNTAAILTTFNEVDLSALTQLRQKYQIAFTERYGVKLGWMSLFAQATVRALQKFPRFNSRIDGDDIVTPVSINLGIAVATPHGLVVPVIKGAEQLHLGELEQSIAALAAKAKDKRLDPSDLADGTFSITNGGTFGSLLSTPILNPPQSGILGMHTIQDRPVAVQGQIVIRPMMYVALSYDHRLIDGQEAVSFLVSIKNTLENPGVVWLGL